MSKVFSKMLIIICFFGLLCPLLVLAKGNITTGISDLKTKIAPGAGFVDQSPAVVIGNTIGLALGLVGIIFLILMVYGGFLWMTARGESEPVEKAQKIIKAAIIGIIIVMSAYAITVLVTGRLSNVGTSTDVNCTGVIDSENKKCGDNMVCFGQVCISECRKKYPVSGDCVKGSSLCNAPKTIAVGLCPGKTVEEGVCCKY